MDSDERPRVETLGAMTVAVWIIAVCMVFLTFLACGAECRRAEAEKKLDGAQKQFEQMQKPQDPRDPFTQ